MNNEQIKQLETELWNAADSLRANSKLTAAEYKDPILGLVFLRFAQNIFEEKKVIIEKSIPDGPRGKRAITKEDFLAAALRMKNVFPDMAISMLAIGEETGEMDSMLSKVAEFYEDEVTTTIKSFTALIEPIMIVFVGGIVGSILVAMYLPMFSVYDKIR